MLIKVVQNFYLVFLLLFFVYSLSLFEFVIHSHKEDKINTFLGFICLSFVFMHLIIFLHLMFQDINLYDFIFPIFLLILVLAPSSLGLLLILSSFIVIIYTKVKGESIRLQEFKRDKIKHFNQTSLAKRDNVRKINHVFIFIGMVVVWFIGVYSVYSVSGSLDGMIPEENDMVSLYLRIFNYPGGFSISLLALGWFYYVLFFFFYAFFFFMLINEISRKSVSLKFPTNLFTSLFLTEKEKKYYGSYFYFAVGHLFASFITPPLVYFAILGISSLADLSASQVGIRFGKRRIVWNNNKTWEGTIACGLISFFITFLFLGFWWALIFSIIMVAIDLLTSKPLDISDNLLIPLTCSIIYALVRFIFHLNYSAIILFWIEL
ncbi:MAG: Cytidylyltransferase family protein [Promethearchaeota archaeon]|nr:MAG: Cytidylyltransferase family protein [Candidatus Lokiarchaeota archaeon]